jgi:NADPH-dependent 2,4-dienoyl-CoA reductase/sulfur reductase-like enzyme
MACANADAITYLTRTRVIAPIRPGVLLVESPAGAQEVHYQRLILATGARELFLPFPGWTLPGVMGAGGLQALVKGGLSIADKSVVIAGSGPLLLAVGAYLKSQGARVRLIAEQTPWSQLGLFGLRLPSHKRRQAQRLVRQLWNVPLCASSWITQAHGTERLEAVTLRRGKRVERLTCDYLACAFGLIPNSELAIALGCVIKNGAVQVDEWQQTSRAHIFCAGEASGIGGLELALLEGQIAGLAATDQIDAARTHFSARQREQHFTTHLTRAFTLRAELKQLADPKTLVCRCEDVSYAELQEHPGWRQAKLQTRCGMGPCQGRVCGSACAFLFGWSPDSVRPPISVTRVANLAYQQIHQEEHLS